MDNRCLLTRKRSGDIPIGYVLYSKAIDPVLPILPNKGEELLGYGFLKSTLLLPHCFLSGLKPRQIVLFCPQEFPDIHEIYRLRHNILQRLLRNADQLRWRLTMVEGDQ
jgi:hypothetical protein